MSDYNEFFSTQEARTYLVSGIGIPDNEFAVLRSGDKVAGVGGPMHGVDLCQVASEGSPGAHLNTTHGVHICSSLGE